MPVKKLSMKEQKQLLQLLPSSRKTACKRHCQQMQMQGQGLKSIMKSIGEFLGPLSKELGPTVLKSFIVPMLKKQMGLGTKTSGGALRLAGQRGSTCSSRGKGLKLAGQRGKGKGKKKVGRPKKKKLGRPRKVGRPKGSGLGSVPLI